MEYLICKNHEKFVKYMDSAKNLICPECISDSEVYLLICYNCRKVNIEYICTKIFTKCTQIYNYNDKYIRVEGIYCEECAFDIKEDTQYLIKCTFCKRNSNIDSNRKCDIDCKIDKYNCTRMFACNQMFVCKYTYNIYCSDCASQTFANDSDCFSVRCYICNNSGPFHVLQRYNNPKKWIIPDRTLHIKHLNIYCIQCFENKSC
jgi:hypothetical protein